MTLVSKQSFDDVLSVGDRKAMRISYLNDRIRAIKKIFADIQASHAAWIEHWDTEPDWLIEYVTEEAEEKLYGLRSEYDRAKNEILRLVNDEKTPISEGMIERAHEYDLVSLFDYPKKVGSLWFAICPFHEDTHPSLVLYKDHYHCYVCEAHGDQIALLMERDQMTFVEAVRALNR